MIARVKIRLSRPFASSAATSDRLPPHDGAEMFVSMARPPAHRWLSAACSCALHAAIISGAAYSGGNTSLFVESPAPRYSVRLIRLQPHSLLPPQVASSGGQAHPAAAVAARAAGSALAASSEDGNPVSVPPLDPN